MKKRKEFDTTNNCKYNKSEVKTRAKRGCYYSVDHDAMASNDK